MTTYPVYAARVAVGWTSERPVRPDQHLSGVVVTADTLLDCTLIAAQMVACRPECEMVTSTAVLESWPADPAEMDALWGGPVPF